MIDTHCHILWGVDDASAMASQSLEMLQIAVQDHISVIVATSHIKYPMFPNTFDSLNQAMALLQQQIELHNLAIKVVMGAENFVNHKTIELLDQNKFVTYNHAGKYMLVEFAWTKNPFDQPTKYLKQILEKGITPVIAHPERYEWVHEDYDLIRVWKDMGCLMQVNRTSILQMDKIKEANSTALRLLEDDFVDMVGSDAHSAITIRKPILSDAYDYIQLNYGKARADKCLYTNPKKIITN